MRSGGALHRFYGRRHEPVHFDRSSGSRFNAPDGTYGVMYVARQRKGAFAEAFLRTPGRTLIDPLLVAARGYARFRLTRSLQVIKLTGSGLARIGATAEVCHRSQPYDVPQSWSKALHDHPTMADGIAYTARHDDTALCVALFDRADDAFVEVERRTDLDQDWFWRLAANYGIGTAPP